MCPGFHTSRDTLDSPVGLNNSELMTEVIRCAVATLATLAEPLSTSLVPSATLHCIPRGQGHGARLSFTVTDDRAPVTIAILSPRGSHVALLAETVYARGTYTLC